MPSVLREHQHELCDVHGDNGFVFGTEDTGYLTLTRPAVEGGESRNNDRDRAQEDGRVFGRDYRGAKTMVFEIGVLTDHLALDPYRANLDYLNSMEDVWTDDRWRDDPRAFAMLRSHEAGQTWRCYGRPRRYEEATGNFTESGYSTVIVDFSLMENAWYSDAEHTVTVHMAPGVEGGLTAPLSAPFSTVQASAGSGIAHVRGSKKTWPVVEFRGPVTNPEVTIGNGFRVGLTRTLGVGEVIVYDPRPWIRAVYRASDGAGMPGAVSGFTTIMKRAQIPVGAHAVRYTGIDPTSSSSVVVRWRDARSRP